jgi:hypothetical protein
MALTWNVSQIIDYKELCWNPCDPPEIGDDGENRVMIDPITDGLIWATLMTGIGTITEKNYEEFWCRLEMNSLLNGPYMRWGEDAKWRGQSAPETKSGYSLEMVYRHIGLKTNAYFKDETYRKWFSRVIAPKLREDAARRLKKQRTLLNEACPKPLPEAAKASATVEDGKLVLGEG